MLPEDHIVFHVDYVHRVVGVVVFEELQDLELDSCLIVVLLLVFDDFESNMLLCLVVEALHSHAKAAPSKVLHDLVAVRDVVFQHDSVVALRVIVPAVVVFLLRVGLGCCVAVLRVISTTRAIVLLLILGWSLGLNLLDSIAKIVDLWEIEDFILFVICQLPLPKLLKALGRSHGYL